MCVLLVFPAVAASPQHLDKPAQNDRRPLQPERSRSSSISQRLTPGSGGRSRPNRASFICENRGGCAGNILLRRVRFSSPTGRRYFSITPDDHQAMKSKLKQSEDMRAPLAFLLGKLDFRKEFKSFQTNGDPAGHLDRRRAEVGQSCLQQGGISGRAPMARSTGCASPGRTARRLDLRIFERTAERARFAGDVYVPSACRRSGSSRKSNRCPISF